MVVFSFFLVVYAKETGLEETKMLFCVYRAC